MVFWFGFLAGASVGMVALVVYACCVISARAEHED